MTGDDAEPPGIEDGRYAKLNIGDGTLVIYDRENHTAWIQCEASLELDDWA